MYTKEEIIEAFAAQRDEKTAAGQAAYMKHRFEFFGIKAPVRRDIQRPFLLKKNLPAKKDALHLIQQLWEEPQRELQYFAMELFFKYHRHLEKKDIWLLEYLINHKSWWDTVDFLASNLVGRYMQDFPEERDTVIEQWLNSGDIWLQRTCLLFQLKYKDKMDTQKLKEIILRLHGTKEFFINKAIGWILREYSKTNPTWVIRFLEDYALSALSRREALKVINR